MPDAFLCALPGGPVLAAGQRGTAWQGASDPPESLAPLKRHMPPLGSLSLFGRISLGKPPAPEPPRAIVDKHPRCAGGGGSELAAFPPPPAMEHLLYLGGEGAGEMQPSQAWARAVSVLGSPAVRGGGGRDVHFPSWRLRAQRQSWAQHCLPNLTVSICVCRKQRACGGDNSPPPSALCNSSKKKFEQGKVAGRQALSHGPTCLSALLWG